MRIFFRVAGLILVTVVIALSGLTQAHADITITVTGTITSYNRATTGTPVGQSFTMTIDYLSSQFFSVPITGCPGSAVC
jgi:hypothetical protein